MRCCVIGGTGFIGSHLVGELLESGRDVVVIGRREVGELSLPENVTYLQGDIKDRMFLEAALEGVDEMVDLVHSSIPKTSYEDPVCDITENLPASVSLFEIVSKLPMKKVLLLSSGGAVYGEPQHLPIRESHPLNPISPYGITKLAIEKYAYMYYRNTGLPVVIARPSNPYGAGQRPFVGQGFVATAIVSALLGRDINIYGDHGTVRDYIYITDVAKALLALLDRGREGESYNIGSSIGKSNLDVVEQIGQAAEKAGISQNIVHDKERPFDVSENILDTSKLASLAGWKPMVSFEDGIQESFDWYRFNYLN